MVRRAQAVAHEVVNATEVMLAPAALAAVTLALWRMGMDLGWTGDFPIREGIWSHWQVWLVVGLGLHMAAKRYRRAA